MVKRQQILWDWAVQAYQRPRVKDICLALQDRFAQDVNGLLWMCWLADQGKAPTRRALDEFMIISREMQAGLIGNIRKIRKGLGQHTAHITSPSVADLKRQLLDLELVIEKSELESLQNLPSKTLVNFSGSKLDLASNHLDLLLAMQEIDVSDCARLCDQLCQAVFNDEHLEP